MTVLEDEMTPDRLMALWAKDRGCKGERYHPLPYHLLDVAAVAEAVWDHVLTEREREEIARRLGLAVEEARRWVSFLAGSHDIGKGSVAFALNVASQRPRLQGAGFWAERMGGDLPHGLVSARALRSVLRAGFGCEAPVAETLAVAVGGHHGVVPSRGELRPKPQAEGEGIWPQAREALIELLTETLGVLRDRPPQADFATAMWLAGFISVVDWIGSNTEYFPCAAPGRAEAPQYDPDYLTRARGQAGAALQGLGWLSRPPSAAPS
ncbi:MAG: CRISPR-associated endonuclease Cas3'', partial [Chloroflexi bacterium]|nr:CRISPR-associated endonuclease Cas3'' [Chloroflexota bacterium]